MTCLILPRYPWRTDISWKERTLFVLSYLFVAWVVYENVRILDAAYLGGRLAADWASLQDHVERILQVFWIPLSWTTAIFSFSRGLAAELALIPVSLIASNPLTYRHYFWSIDAWLDAKAIFAYGPCGERSTMLLTKVIGLMIWLLTFGLVVTFQVRQLYYHDLNGDLMFPFRFILKQWERSEHGYILTDNQLAWGGDYVSSAYAFLVGLQLGARFSCLLFDVIKLVWHHFFEVGLQYFEENAAFEVLLAEIRTGQVGNQPPPCAFCRHTRLCRWMFQLASKIHWTWAANWANTTYPQAAFNQRATNARVFRQLWLAGAPQNLNLEQARLGWWWWFL